MQLLRVERFCGRWPTRCIAVERQKADLGPHHPIWQWRLLALHEPACSGRHSVLKLCQVAWCQLSTSLPKSARSIGAECCILSAIWGWCGVAVTLSYMRCQK